MTVMAVSNSFMRMAVSCSIIRMAVIVTAFLQMRQSVEEHITKQATHCEG